VVAFVAAPSLAQYVSPTIPAVGVICGGDVKTGAGVGAGVGVGVGDAMGATVTAPLLATVEPNRPTAVTSRTRVPDFAGVTVVPLPIDAPESSHRRL
jgi:hypothetical protein